MALTVLDKQKIGGYLQKMWQKELNTDEDPANGQWFDNGAGGSPAGLYGGLTDSAATALNFNESQKSYTPQAVVCNSAVVDNLNGLAGSSTVTLSYAYTNSSSTTHTTSDSIKAGVAVSIKASATFFGIGADVTTQFTFDYTHSWSDSTTQTDTHAYTFSQQLPITVPAGKVYKVVLTALSQQLVIPYTAVVSIGGITETWFEDRINGHYNWTMGGSEAFAKIGQNGLAGTDSASFTSQGVVQTGTVTAQQTTNFVAKVYDITSTYKPDGPEPAMRRASIAGGPASTPVSPDEGVLVGEFPFPTPA